MHLTNFMIYFLLLLSSQSLFAKMVHLIFIRHGQAQHNVLLALG
jgi:hypothetical protein